MDQDDDFDKAAFLEQLGKTITKIRKSKGFSQDRLSLEGGVSRGVLYRIETGQSDPQATTLAKIAEVLDIPIGRFFEFKKNK